MSMIYSTESWHMFDHLCRVMMNYFAYHDVNRSLLRNIVFNTLRCMSEEVVFYFVYGTVDPWSILTFRIVSIWLLTVFV